MVVPFYYACPAVSFFPLGLTLYTKDYYTFTLGSCSFALKPVPVGDPTHVPVLLFTSWVG